MPSEQLYIDANNLSPKELAVVLNDLAKNETEHDMHLEYRSQNLSKAFEAVALRSYTHPNALCRLGYYYNSKKRLNSLPLGE